MEDVVSEIAKLIGAGAVAALVAGGAYVFGVGRKNPGQMVILRKRDKPVAPWGAALLALLPKTAKNDEFVFKPYQAPPNAATLGDALNAINQVKSSGALPGIGQLLNVIGAVEAPRGYDQVWGKIRRKDQPPRPLTQMTVGQVLDWQDSIDPFYQSEAAGRYQVMEDTLRELVQRGKVNKNERFTPATQDKIAVILMEKRGLKDYRAGRIGPEKFADNLAREWAGLGVQKPQQGRSKFVKRGESYYAGDGLNKAKGRPQDVLSAVRQIRRV